MVTVLLAGVPRSGTSWTGEALGRCAGARYVDEPDGFRDAYAFRLMMELGEHPWLEPGTDHPHYAALWRGAFAGGARSHSPLARGAEWAYHRAGTDARRVARATGKETPWLRLARAAARPPVAAPDADHVVAKSVQCQGSLEWIAEQFRPVVIVLTRHPLNVVASWRDLHFVRNPREMAMLGSVARSRWDVAAPPPDAPAVTQQAFYAGVLGSVLVEAAARHPEWITAEHEALCRAPAAELGALAARAGLTWTAAATEFVERSDRAGAGFATARVAAEQPDRWRERLSPEEVAAARAGLAGLPVGARVDG